LSRPSPSLDAPALRFHRLTFAPDGDEVVIGRRDIDSYGVFPVDGAALLRQLESGRSLDDAARWYEETYGEPVDVDGFLETLTDLEFLRDGDDDSAEAEPVPVRWQRLGAALFSPLAAVVYATVVVTAIVLAVRDPSLAPHHDNIFFTSSLVAVELTVLLGQLPLSGMHELAHLLAGRRLGLASRIRLSNRLYFVVFETTLDGLVSVPRRRRYLPMLAGMGADLVAMAALTVAAALTRGADGSPTLVSGVCLALAFSTIPRIAWQFYFFLETDVYHLAATVSGCIDLQATSRQWLANRGHRLLGHHDRLVDEEQWHPRDRQVARWYAPLMLVGYAVAIGMAVVVAIPIAWRLVHSAFTALVSDDVPASRFWDAAALFALTCAHFALARYLARRDKRAGRARTRSHHLAIDTEPALP
jgi:hypothetical protein